jgi:hypothetical protein
MLHQSRAKQRSGAMMSSQGQRPESQKQIPAAAAKTMDRYEITSGCTPRRTQRRTAVSAVRRNGAAIGLRDTG